MDGGPAGKDDLGAYDLLLVGFFFISCSVLALAQLNALFGGNRVRFGLVALVPLLFASGAIDAASLCGADAGDFICGDGGQRLRALARIWTWVSAAALGMYLFVRLLAAVKGRRP